MSITRVRGLGGESSGGIGPTHDESGGGPPMKSADLQQGARPRPWSRIRQSWSWATTAKVGVVLVFLIVDIVLFFGTGRASDSESSASPDPTNARTAMAPDRTTEATLSRIP